jgi:hypothetical protein
MKDELFEYYNVGARGTIATTRRQGESTPHSTDADRSPLAVHGRALMGLACFTRCLGLVF